jgi:glutaredoxin
MKRTLSQSLAWLLAAIVLTSTLPVLGKTEILDPAAYHPLLRVIADDLNTHGIDVIQNWNSRVSGRTRIIIAPLSDYLTSLPLRGRWESELESGEMGALVAQPGDNPKSDTFYANWSKLPRGQRIFISFAREDAAFAEIVRKVLKDRGYGVFIYIEDPKEKPTISLASVREYLQTAGMHLVLDTATARQKPGVLAEALWHAKYGPPQARVIVGIKKGDVVEIYGARNRCPRTRQVLAIAEKAGAKITYHDVDGHPTAREVATLNRAWLKDGELMPYVKINGRPILAQDIELFGVLKTERTDSLITNCSMLLAP